MALLKWDPNTSGGQYLEDLSTAYWYSDALFTALDLSIFEHLSTGNKTLNELTTLTGCEPSALERFLHLLKTLDLVGCYEESYYNTTLTDTWLVKGRSLYQGDSILWRRAIAEDWLTLKDALKAGRRVHFLPEDTSEAVLDERREAYITAMDNVIRLKVPEILEYFGNGLKDNAKILDVGAGSGAFSNGFLSAFPTCQATLIDIRQVLPQTKKMMAKVGMENDPRVHFCDRNILESDWQLSDRYDVIILSNIVHAYAEEEISLILKTASDLLTDDGILLIHDFFLDHWDIKAAFSDLNMFINTYNGKVFDSHWVIDQLKSLDLAVTPMIPLETDTAVIFAAKDTAVLDHLTLSPVSKLLSPIKNIGFEAVIPFDPKAVVTAPFAQNKCKFGCRSWDKKHCSTNLEMTTEETRRFLDSFSKALLLKSEPPTGDFQRKALRAETLAFKAGYYKAFVFWAGPCSICPDCDLNAPCQNRKHSRPSMEGSGIDVFATVSQAGETLKTLKERGEVIKYYALLLLE